MKVNFNVPILALNNQQMQEPGFRVLAEGEEQVDGKQYQTEGDVTYERIMIKLFARNFVVHALSQDYDDERATITDDDKYDRYKLLQRIEASKDNAGDQQIVSVTSTEIQTIRKLISKLYSPVVVGQIIDILEGE